MGLQRRDGRARRRRQRHPAHLRRRPRDRLDAHRSGRRCPRPHAHQGRRMGGAAGIPSCWSRPASWGCGSALPRAARSTACGRICAPPCAGCRVAATCWPCRGSASTPSTGAWAGPCSPTRARTACDWPAAPRGCSRGCSRPGSPTRATGSTPWAGAPTPRWRAGSRRVAPAGARRRPPRPAAHRRAHRPLQRARGGAGRPRAPVRRSPASPTIGAISTAAASCWPRSATTASCSAGTRWCATARAARCARPRRSPPASCIDIELADGHVDAQALSGGARDGRQAAAAGARRTAAEERSAEAEAKARCSEWTG